MIKRILLFQSLIIILISCGFEKEKLEMELPFEFGVITFENYLQFDWEFEWLDYSDMANLEERKVRFSKNEYNPLCESGSIHTNHPDSVYQMTLSSYTEYAKREFSDLKPNWGFEELLYFKQRFNRINRLNYHIVDTTYIQWLGHDGYRITYENGHKNYPGVYRAYVVDTKFSHIELLFECTGEKCSNFISDVDKTVMSMKFKR